MIADTPTLSRTSSPISPSAASATGAGSQSSLPIQEGRVARAIEQQTAKIPSDFFLWAAGGCIVGSLVYRLFNRRDTSLFIGEWVPSLLLLGVYNKLVKQLGSDRTENLL